MRILQNRVEPETSLSRPGPAPNVLASLAVLACLNQATLSAEASTRSYAGDLTASKIATACFPNTQFRDFDARLGSNSDTVMIGAQLSKTIGHPSIIGSRPTIKTATVYRPSITRLYDFTTNSSGKTSEIARVESRSYLVVFPKNTVPNSKQVPICIPARRPNIITKGNPSWFNNTITVVSPRPTIKCRLSDRDKYPMAGLSITRIFVKAADPRGPFNFGLHINEEGVIPTSCRPMYTRDDLRRIRNDPLKLGR